jgi:hypothetical protein
MTKYWRLAKNNPKIAIAIVVVIIAIIALIK